MRLLWIGNKQIKQKTQLYLFRKKINAKKDDCLNIKISADSRYYLYVNKKYVCNGPCLGRNNVKFYDEINLSKYLKNGENIIEVKVLHVFTNLNEFTFTSCNHNLYPALFVKGELVCSNGEKMEISSDLTWELYEDNSVTFIKNLNYIAYNEILTNKRVKRIPCEIVVVCEENGKPYNRVGYQEIYLLSKREIPFMYTGKKTSFRVVKSGEHFVELDAKDYVTANLQFKIKAPKGVEVKIIYSECYYEKNSSGKLVKNKRDNENGFLNDKVYDKVIGNGRIKTFVPLWYRSFRYIRIESSEKFDYEAYYEITHYPLDIQGSFKCSETIFNDIFDISKNTLLCCTHEILIDCPHYEQLQYDMDSALEGLFLMTLSSDHRLIKKAIKDLSASQGCDGLLSANYPSSGQRQVIPIFSIYWIMLLYEYYSYSGDKKIVKQQFGVLQKILNSFENFTDKKGLIAPTIYWDFLDWVEGWNLSDGQPFDAKTSPMSVYSMIYSYGLKLASKLAIVIGDTGQSEDYENKRIKLNQNINKYYFDETKQMYMLTLNGGYSVHTAVWAILSEVTDSVSGKKLLEKSLNTDIEKCSFAMNFFTFRALEKVGLYNKYATELIKDWRTMYDLGCKTWCENPTSPRSECHGWSAAPIYEFISCVVGIKPVDGDNSQVNINPYYIKELQNAEGTFPTQKGQVFVRWEKFDNGYKITIKLPNGIHGNLTLPDGKTKRINTSTKIILA